MNNKDTEAFVLLKKKGDPFERVICCYKDKLSPVIYPYAKTWADFVYPYREGDGSIVKEERMPFAGSHYTALIRLYHAMNALEKIEKIEKDFEDGNNQAKLLLDAHLATAIFWESLGSCIDNLALAFEDQGLINGNWVDDKGEELEGATGRDGIKVKYNNLNEAYDRRTQFIHSRLVPLKVDNDGALTFNMQLLDSKNTYWSTESKNEEEFLHKYCKDFWEKCLEQLGNAWQYLYCSCKDKESQKRDEQKKSVGQSGPVSSGITKPAQIKFPTPNNLPTSGIKYEGPGDKFPSLPPSG